MSGERITPDEIRALRAERGWSQKDLAGILNTALGRSYTGDTVGKWERGRQNVSAAASAFLYGLAAEEANTPPLDGDHVHPGGPTPQAAPDQPPQRELPSGPAAPMLTGSGLHTKACTELWEIVATGVGTVGAAIGSDALVEDGRIINRDKEALGAAWGKLAEQNETFRKMLEGMTEGGAWLQVALVTGTTFSRCYQSHDAIAQRKRAAAAYVAPTPEPDDVDARLHAV